MDAKTILLFKAKSNTLKLNIQKIHKKGDIRCDICGDEREDLVNFLVDCKELEGVRDKKIMKEFCDTNKEHMIGEILQTKDRIEAVKEMLETMW